MENANNIYYTSIRQIIKEGGDTDTNACIVGGMLGALVGLSKIPQNMVKNVVEFDCEAKLTQQKMGQFDDGAKLGKNRPNLLNVKKHLLPNI